MGSGFKIKGTKNKNKEIKWLLNTYLEKQFLKLLVEVALVLDYKDFLLN